MQDSDELLIEKVWVTTELGIADINIRYHEDLDSRASGTIEQWRSYRCDLRDYIKGNVAGHKRPNSPVYGE